MYNSQNLPLSKKKIFKKSFGLVLALFLALLVLIGFGMLVMFSNGDEKTVQQFSFAIVIAILVDIFAIGGVIYYQYLYYKLYYYNFEDDSAEIKKGVVSVSTGHVRYGKIQNIFVDQDIFDRILGLYDVHYETAGETSGNYSHVDGMEKENADKLKDFLMEKSRKQQVI